MNYTKREWVKGAKVPVLMQGGKMLPWTVQQPGRAYVTLLRKGRQFKVDLLTGKPPIAFQLQPSEAKEFRYGGSANVPVRAWPTEVAYLHDVQHESYRAAICNYVQQTGCVGLTLPQLATIALTLKLTPDFDPKKVGR